MIRDYEHEKGIEKDARKAEELDRKARQDEPMDTKSLAEKKSAEDFAEAVANLVKLSEIDPIAAANERIMGDLARGLGMIDAASEPPVLALCAKCLTLTASVGRLCAPCCKQLAIDCNENLESNEFNWPDPRRDDEDDDWTGDAR